MEAIAIAATKNHSGIRMPNSRPEALGVNAANSAVKNSQSGKKIVSRKGAKKTKRGRLSELHQSKDAP